MIFELKKLIIIIRSLYNMLKGNSDQSPKRIDRSPEELQSPIKRKFSPLSDKSNSSEIGSPTQEGSASKKLKPEDSMTTQAYLVQSLSQLEAKHGGIFFKGKGKDPERLFEK